MTIPETNTACSLRHIGVLATHGAEVQGPNGRQKLGADFFLYVMNECREKGFNAVCYELFLPEISDALLISIHRDGRVNTGSEKNVIMALDC